MISTREAYDQAAAGYNERHDSVSQRKYQRIEASIRELLKAERVLDLGCGTGRLTQGIIGIDLSVNMLRQCPPGCRVACADGHHLPFANSSFDAVIAAQGVIRYLQWPKLFGEMARVLCTGGRAAVHTFGDVLSLRTFKRVRHELNLRKLEDIVEPARAAGMVPLEIELWRPIRVPPYALRVPNWLPGDLWTHCIAVFEKAPC